MSNYSLGVGNTTLSTATLSPVAMGLATNYAKTTDDAEIARIKNSTTALDQQEMITYRSRSISKVGPDIPVYNPGVVQDGVLYSINIQDILRETKTNGDIVDHPIEMWLTVKHDVTAAWTESGGANDPSYVGVVLRRLLGACYTDAGVERFDSLAKSALVPTTD